MLSAYQQGIFPWFSPQDPILWWSPDPRAVIFPEQFHLSRSMARFHRRSPFHLTLDQDFSGVIQGCAQQRQDGTWITEEVITAWLMLFRLGHAHSVEVWQDDRLVGGLYGLSLGRLFCAESMFSRQENASKTALMMFCRHFQAFGGQLIDCQILNPHTASLGATEISRQDYLTRMRTLITQPLLPSCWQGMLQG
ncbi:leucyl/phenylalanyl-tRNA--protein transferase [Tatumella saanichensis]|uniref:leucyl/phenylalanyl-tRNA--protein transferase n=1 Tax=Tatumella saanichensis TaxID=480813 RepID=UPI001F4C7EDF|nr:leucyl/phenylalanyl-tRNA--protein transferase [Tatumella saanichensis]